MAEGDRLPMRAPLSSLNLTCPVLAAPMAGGPTTPAEVAAVLQAGADAVAVGTALLRSDESGASAVHQAAIADSGRGPTVLTRAFTGRLASAVL
jgi:nitronate monooxygenase